MLPFTSRKLSTTAGITPNAPGSEPQAMQVNDDGGGGGEVQGGGGGGRNGRTTDPDEDIEAIRAARRIAILLKDQTPQRLKLTRIKTLSPLDGHNQ